MAILTEKQKEKFMECGGIECPFCGNTDPFDVQIRNGNSHGTLFEFSCDECENEWLATFKMLGVTTMDAIAPVSE